jgi:hypothetical protein
LPFPWPVKSNQKLLELIWFSRPRLGFLHLCFPILLLPSPLASRLSYFTPSRLAYRP